MSNPADLLHRLLTSWNGHPNISTESVRQDDSLKEHTRAVGYLRSIDKALAILEAEGKKVAVYRRTFPLWTRMVFNYPRNWRGTNKGAIDRVALDHLETLIDRIDEIAPQIEVDKVAVLTLYLSAVDLALKDDDSLPAATRHQVSTVIRQIRDYVENLDHVDSFDFQKAISQLFAALAHAVLQSQNRARWQGWAENFVWMGFGDAYSKASDVVYSLATAPEALLSLSPGG